MTNLLQFLKRVKADATGTPPFTVNITRQELEWLDQFLNDPDHEIHFKARILPGADPDNPVVEQDYMIAGEEINVFCLLTEAMLQNTTFAVTVQRAARFYQEHVPGCEACKATILESTRRGPNWKFSPHNP